VAFVLDVNLRIQEILGLQKVEAALSKLQGSAQTGAAAGGATSAAAASKASAAAAAANAAAVDKVTVANNKLAASQRKSASSTRKVADGMKDATNKADSFGKSVAIAGKRYAAFLAATVAPFAALGGISKATAAVIEFDSAMLKMRQIAGQTQEQMLGTRDTILDLATSTGTSASEIARVGKVLLQAGIRGDELTEALTTLSKVPLTPSFETMDAAIEGTIAATKQFRDEGLSTADVLDVLTSLSNKFAASSEDIAKGISRGGAAFEAIGGTFQEFAAVFTTIRQSTRESAETVGTFMKTISSRLADPKIVAFLEGKGIRIGEAIEAGNPVEALKRIASAMEGITSVQDRIEIGTKLGGRRQISRLLALISNVDTLDEALQTAAASSGSFGAIAEQGLEGLQAQLNILVQEFNKLVQTLAEPLFVPIIQGATTVGKAFVTIVDVVRPVIPALTTIVGFAAGFKLLAVSIGAASKALAYMSTVGVGGGIPGILTAAGAAGGAAGASARERVQRRLAGGVGGAGAGAAVGAGVARGARAAAASPLAQLAVVTGVILAADKMSDSFEEAGQSSGILAAEFAKAVGVLLIATSLLSGKSITGAIGGLVTALGPWGAAIAAATAALGAFTYAAKQSVDFDVQGIIDAAARKVAETKIEPIAAGDTEAFQEAIGGLGTEAISGIQEAARRYEDGWSGFFASAYERVSNLFQGEGLVTISNADAQRMIEEIIGDNPQLLNEILRSAIEQFGVAGLEGGIDQALSEAFGGNLEAASRVRQVMITQLGGLEKIAQSIDQVQMDAKVSALSNAIQKASDDFEKLHVPVTLSNELILLSDAVGNAARAIETNVTTFDRLSQIVGQDVGVSLPGTEWSREAVERLAGTGDIGDLIDLSQLPQLEGFTTDIARVGRALDDFMKSVIKSKANADSLASLLADPKVDPFDILGDYIDQFIAQSPDKLPAEAEAAFRASAANLGEQLKRALVDQAGVLPTAEEVQKAFQDTLGKQQPFYDAAITTFKTWLDAQSQQLNLALSGEELLAGVDVGTSDLGETIVASLQNALKLSGAEIALPPEVELGLVNANEAIVSIAQSGDLVGEVLRQYETSYKRHAELNREIAEAQKTGEGASLDLLKSSKEAATEVLNLQVALSQLAKIAQQAPQALSELQQDQAGSFTQFSPIGMLGTGTDAMAEFARRLQEDSEAISEFINRQRQFIEAQTAVDVSQAFEEPADIFARALTESASAVRAFTSALTEQDIRGGAGAPDVRVTPEGRVYAERRPVPEAGRTDESRTVDRRNLQSALFGAEMGRVMETLLESAAANAESTVSGLLLENQQEQASANLELAKSFREFGGFIYDIPKLIGESGLDTEEIARAAAVALKEQATQPGAAEVENIGALRRTVTDLTSSLQTLIDRPEVARDPELISPQLSPAVQDYLQKLSQPTERVPAPETTPRVFEDLSASASDIQRAASETRTAADETARSTTDMRAASADMRTGGADMLSASQGMSDSIQQLQAVVDIQREAITGQQEAVAGGVSGESTREAMVATTEAVNSLGERMDAVAKAVDLQTQQEAELAAAQREQPLEVAGLEDNTSVIASNTEVASKTQEGMSSLSSGMEKMAGAIQEGVGIDVETMSEITVDVTGVGAAAREFTAEFEAVAQRVAKAEINAVLQQLARNAGNSEAANAFESALT